MAATPARAATFTVNSTADVPDANPGSGGCATTGGACTLRAAVQEANALVAAGTASANVINVPGGTYALTIAGRGEDAAATGDLDVNGGALEVRGAGAGATIIDGNQLDRLFHLGTLVTLSDPATARPTRFSLEDATVRNGNAVSTPPSLSTSGPDVGGAIRIEKNSGLAVRRAIFRGNRAGQRGGAIAMPPSAGTVVGADPAITTTLTDVTLEGNSAGVEGGATFNNRVAFFTRVVVQDNTVTGTDTSGPNAPRGGGIAQSGDLSLTDVIVRGNSMTTGNGGGIANRGDPAAQPPVFGTIRLNRVTVNDNSAAQGGGVGSGNGATADITNTTISGNRAPGGGGGVANAGTATLTNVTLSGNSASGGGAIVTLGPPVGASTAAMTLRNTILADSTGGNCLPPPNPIPFARLPTSGGDNISSDASCNLTGPGDSNTTDPRLGPLADNGGFTPTHALVPGSPAINGIRTNPCPPPATDQRGVTRPQGPRCDIGAYERSVPPTVPPTVPPVYPGPVAPFAGCPVSVANVIRGTSGRELIIGTAGADRIFAGAGDDSVDALAGDDCVDLGPGTDLGRGGVGDDLILGGPGSDRLIGGPGGDRLSGGLNGDRIDAGGGNDRAFGEQGNDRISGDLGDDALRGGPGSDRIFGRSGRDRINGGRGRDVISGGNSGDRASGDGGNDRINGGRGRDRINGGSGHDRIGARDGARDRINCGRGRDRVLADRIDRVARNCERVTRRSRRPAR